MVMGGGSLAVGGACKIEQLSRTGNWELARNRSWPIVHGNARNLVKLGEFGTANTVDLEHFGLPVLDCEDCRILDCESKIVN